MFLMKSGNVQQDSNKGIQLHTKNKDKNQFSLKVLYENGKCPFGWMRGSRNIQLHTKSKSKKQFLLNALYEYKKCPLRWMRGL